MNEYKLPKGIQNKYTLLIDRRLNDVLKVITDPDQPKYDSYAIIYLRKVNGTWQVDPSGGPWCTLEEFEQKNCH